jgi:hypothetical protein
MGVVVEEEVKALLQAALTVAKDAVVANKRLHDGLSSVLESQERCECVVVAQLAERAWLLIERSQV